MNTKNDILLGDGHFWRKHLFIISLLTLPLQIFASHIVGGEIGYRCLGGDEYEITLDLYRDCFYGAEDAQFDDPASIGIFNLGNNSLFTELKVDFTVDDTLDAILNDPCLFVPSDVCVHTTSYRTTVTLPPSDVGYKIVYQRCCRNETIANIEDPFNTGATYEIDLTPEAMEVCNQSPRFRSWPPIFICINKPIFYDHSAIAPDGDSLVYSLCTPNQGATFDLPQPQPPGRPPYDPVIFRESAFGLDNLLGAGEPLHINSRTGRITGLPTLQGQFVVGVCVEEYRDGVLLSTTRRDFQYNVGRCEEVEAVIVAPAAQCENLTVEFNNNSTQADEFEWHFDYPNDPRAISTEANPTYTYPDTGRYTVMLIAEPNSSCVDTSFTEVYLQNNSLLIDFEIEKADCSSSSVLGLVDFSTDTISDIATYFWEIVYDGNTITSTDPNPVIDVPLDVRGTVTLTVTSVNGCVRSLTKSFQTGEEDPGSELRDTLYVCFGDSIQLNPDARTLTSYNYAWTPSESLNDPTIANPTAYVEETTLFTVMVSPNNDLCSFEQMVTVVVLDRPELDFMTDNSCDGLTVTFNNTSENTDRYQWNFGDENTNSDTSIIRSPTYTYPDTGTYQVTLIADTLGRCADTITRPVVLTERTLVAAIAVDYADCSTDAITAQFNDVSTNSMNNTASRSWEFSNGETSTDAQPTLTVDATQTIVATLTITTEEGCMATTTDTFTFELITTANIVDEATICTGESVELNPQGDTTYQYNWTPVIGLDDPTAANPTATPDSTTTYTVTITNLSADTCQLTHTTTILVNATPALLVNEDVLTCDPEAIIFAESEDAINIEYLNAAGEVLASGDNTYTVPVSGSTDYIVRATATNGCTTSEPINISGGPVDIAIEGGDVFAVCQGEEIQLNVENKDPNDTLSYRWEPATEIIANSNSAMPTIREAVGERTFFVAATSQYDCTANDSIQVVVIDTTFQLGFTAALQCDGQTVNFTNTSTNAFGYFWNFGDGQGTSTAKDPSYAYSEPGTYEVYLTLQYDVSCTDTIRQQVDIFEPNLTPTFTFDYNNCDGASTTIQFNNQTTTNLSGDLTYNWTFSNNQSSNAENPQITLDESQALITELCVTSRNGCQSCTTDTLNVTVVKLDLADELSLCPGESAGLNPNGNPDLIYQWSPAEGLDDPTAANPIASPLTTTEYTVTVQNFSADTCQVTQTVRVNVTEDIGLDIGVDDTVITCGTDTTITATVARDGATFEWTNADGRVISEMAMLTVNPTDTATYYITATLNGCTEMDSVTVINNGFETGDIANELNLCPNESTELNPNGNPDLMYQWSPAEGLDDPTAANPIASPMMTTEYTVTIQNATNNTCQVTETVLVNVAEEIGLTIDMNGDTNENTTCGEDAVITAMTIVNGASFKWTDEDGNILSEGGILTINPADTATYYITAEFGGCTEMDSITIINNGIDTSISIGEGGTAGGDNQVCENTEFQLIATNNRPEQTVTYNWTAGTNATIVAGAATAMPTVMAVGEGTAIFYLDATNEFNCTFRDSITVEITPFMPNLMNEVVACEGDPTPLNPTGNPDYTYLWSPAEFLDDPMAANPLVTTSTATTFTVMITNGGCVAEETVEVEVAPSPNLMVSKDTVVCNDSAITLFAEASIPADYEWSTDPDFTETISTDSILDIESVTAGETTYFVRAMGQNQGCTQMSSINVNNAEIEVDIAPTFNLCAGDEIELTVTNLRPNQNLNYFWSPTELIIAGADSNSPSVSPMENTAYTAEVENEFGCFTTISTDVAVTDLESIVATVTAEPASVVAGASTQLNATVVENATYTWSPASTLSQTNVADPVATPEVTTTYELEVSMNGCVITRDVEVEVINPQCEFPFIFVPNAFTPNNDGENDDFRVYGSFIEEMNLIVYNRWGQKVFETNDQQIGWDGTFNGKVLPPDAFGYYLTVRCIGGQEYTTKGNVSLLK